MIKSASYNSNRVGGCFAVGIVSAFALAWSGATLTFDSIIAWGVCRQVRALGYMTAGGHITQSEVEENRRRDHQSPTYRPNIKYTFYVGDQTCHGTQYRYGGLRWSSKKYAQHVVADYPVDKHVTVHYRPDDPSDAVLRVGIDGEDLFMILFMTPFNVVMLGIWYGAGGSLLAKVARPPAGGAKVWDDGECVHVRLISIGPATVAAAVAGGMSFVGVFVVGFGFGGDPTLPVMVATWAVILGTAMFGYMCRQMKLMRGDSDLLMDNIAQTVALPRSFGRKERVIVPRHRFLAVDVERVEKTDSEGASSWRYVPVASFTDEEGNTRRERIVEWSRQSAAEGLAAWLRDQLRLGQPAGHENAPR